MIEIQSIRWLIHSIDVSISYLMIYPVVKAIEQVQYSVQSQQSMTQLKDTYVNKKKRDAIIRTCKHSLWIWFSRMVNVY